MKKTILLIFVLVIIISAVSTLYFTSQAQMESNDSSDKSFIWEIINNRILRKPSTERESAESEKEDSLTFIELSNQFFDETSESLMNYAHDYSAGDYIILKDEIVEIEYFPVEDITMIGFKSDMGTDYITFRGDITNDYSVGEIINLQFQLLPIDDTEYVELDYQVDYYENEAPPDIKDYILQ